MSTTMQTNNNNTTQHNNNALNDTDTQPNKLPKLESVPFSSTVHNTNPVQPIPQTKPNGEPIKWIAIQTVQANCSVNVKVDLRAVASKARNAVYEPRLRSGAVVLQCKHPRATANVFNSGAMVLIGSGSETDMKISARKIARQIQLSLIQSSADIESAKLIVDTLRFTGYRVNNVGGSGSIGFTVDLDKLSHSAEYSDDITFDPERFPGLQYRMLNPDVSTTVFYNGSVTITGGKCESDIYRGYDKLYQLLLPYATSPIPHPSVQVQHLTHTLNKIEQMQQGRTTVGNTNYASYIIDPKQINNNTAIKRNNNKLQVDDPDNLDFDDLQWE